MFILIRYEWLPSVGAALRLLSSLLQTNKLKCFCPYYPFILVYCGGVKPGLTRVVSKYVFFLAFSVNITQG